MGSFLQVDLHDGSRQQVSAKRAEGLDHRGLAVTLPHDPRVRKEGGRGLQIGHLMGDPHRLLQATVPREVHPGSTAAEGGIQGRILLLEECSPRGQAPGNLLPARQGLFKGQSRQLLRHALTQDVEAGPDADDASPMRVKKIGRRPAPGLLGPLRERKGRISLLRRAPGRQGPVRLAQLSAEGLERGRFEIQHVVRHRGHETSFSSGGDPVCRCREAAQPTEPSISSLISRLSSTAYSRGSSLVKGSKKPLTIMVIASSSESPRLIR